MKISNAKPPHIPPSLPPAPSRRPEDQVTLGEHRQPPLEKATLWQKAVATTGVAATATVVAGLAYGGAFSSMGAGLAVAGSMVGAYFLADISTGLVHHFLDNVDPKKLPGGLARIADDFQNHHDHPRDVVHREFANHTADTQRITTPMLAGLAALAWTLPQLAPLTAGLTVFANCANLAQEFHRRAHMSDAENPALVNLCQKVGLMVPRRLHLQHHGAGHKSHYALLNGATNKILDDVHFRLTPGGVKSNLLRKMEVALYHWQGSEPNNWAETPGLKEQALRGIK
ncbi:hypothetical protein IV102_35165 [bacterium]|nr:hypothetical protein [bacterium]